MYEEQGALACPVSRHFISLVIWLERVRRSYAFDIGHTPSA